MAPAIQPATERMPSRAPERTRLPRPFLKWAGGKGQLLDQLRPLLPRQFGSYFEPFVGGGALFFDTRPRGGVLSDLNRELIDCYQAIRDDVDAVLDALAAHRHEAEHYYEVRARDPATLAPAERAARTIYLNRTGYNGLYRVNSSGRFNVPFGRYANPRIRDPENLRACAQALADVDLEVADFPAVAGWARPGDFVYFDPPYVPLSETADFTAYVAGGFGFAQQRALASLFAELAGRGVLVMLSNSETPLVRELYQGFHVHTVEASRLINSNARRRGKVQEVVVTSY